MGRSNKSKRFVQQGKNSVQQHDQRIPYHLTLEQSERKAEKMENSSLGGI
ncbi:hypothetical protein ACWE42_18905 [Sutcliffiella cohnii]|nr:MULTISPECIES: hypothetical protein [Sutcliffiella]MED4016860.1 hypothetical protein [Sutcliffiella cohnii]WBL16225.1 hypothetical protein O1A01_06235 [Sutcliffiella sp. NC1]